MVWLKILAVLLFSVLFLTWPDLTLHFLSPVLGLTRQTSNRSCNHSLITKVRKHFFTKGYRSGFGGGAAGIALHQERLTLPHFGNPCCKVLVQGGFVAVFNHADVWQVHTITGAHVYLGCLPIHYLARNKWRQGPTAKWSVATAAPLGPLPVREAGRGSEVVLWRGLENWGRQRMKKKKNETHLWISNYGSRHKT